MIGIWWDIKFLPKFYFFKSAVDRKRWIIYTFGGLNPVKPTERKWIPILGVSYLFFSRRTPKFGNHFLQCKLFLRYNNNPNQEHQQTTPHRLSPSFRCTSAHERTKSTGKSDKTDELYTCIRLICGGLCIKTLNFSILEYIQPYIQEINCNH